MVRKVHCARPTLRAARDLHTLSLAPVVFRRFRLNLLLPLLFLPRSGLRAAIGIHALAESYEFIEVEMPIPIRVEVGKKLLDLPNENCRRRRQDSSAAKI